MLIDTTYSAPDCQYLPDMPKENDGVAIAIFWCGNYNAWYDDIFVTINFTALPVASTERRYLGSDSVFVMLSYTNDTKQAVTHTKPSLLIPGIDLIGIENVRVQQTFKNHALSTLGLFDVRSIPLLNLLTH